MHLKRIFLLFVWYFRYGSCHWTTCAVFIVFVLNNLSARCGHFL